METKISKTRNTFNVVCLIRKNRVLKNGEVPMFIRITMKGQVADIPLTGTVYENQIKYLSPLSRHTIPEPS